jgi:hypothetical protein
MLYKRSGKPKISYQKYHTGKKTANLQGFFAKNWSIKWPKAQHCRRIFTAFDAIYPRRKQRGIGPWFRKKYHRKINLLCIFVYKGDNLPHLH